MQTGPGDVDYRSLLGLDMVITQAQAYGAIQTCTYVYCLIVVRKTTFCRSFAAGTALLPLGVSFSCPWEVCNAADKQGSRAALCGSDPGMKVLLSLADNWKYPGGVDQYVDWSSTTPERGDAHPRAPDTEGDTDNTVRQVAPGAVKSQS